MDLLRKRGENMLMSQIENSGAKKELLSCCSKPFNTFTELAYYYKDSAAVKSLSFHSCCITPLFLAVSFPFLQELELVALKPQIKGELNSVTFPICNEKSIIKTKVFTEEKRIWAKVGNTSLYFNSGIATNLKKLVLSDNSVTGIMELKSTEGKDDKSETVEYHQNPAIHINDKMLQGFYMPSLVYLDLSNNKISKVSDLLPALKIGAPSLKKLFCLDNPFVETLQEAEKHEFPAEKSALLEKYNTSEPGYYYRSIFFSELSSLTVLDGRDSRGALVEESDGDEGDVEEGVFEEEEEEEEENDEEEFEVAEKQTGLKRGREE